MKNYAIIIILLLVFSVITIHAQTPLSRFSKAWNDPKYQVCNTAAGASYMSAREKELMFILNMARMNPKLFGETVVAKYPDSSDHPGIESSPYYLSLKAWLPTIQPSGILQPDSLCYISAHCHAVASGKSGYVGHERTPECKWVRRYYGECADYGNSTAFEILMSLFIDDGVESLGHRTGCFDDKFKSLGVSIEPHEKYGTNAVMDFYYPY